MFIYVILSADTFLLLIFYLLVYLTVTCSYVNEKNERKGAQIYLTEDQVFVRKEFICC